MDESDGALFELLLLLEDLFLCVDFSPVEEQERLLMKYGRPPGSRELRGMQLKLWRP